MLALSLSCVTCPPTFSLVQLMSARSAHELFILWSGRVGHIGLQCHTCCTCTCTMYIVYIYVPVYM